MNAVNLKKQEADNEFHEQIAKIEEKSKRLKEQANQLQKQKERL